MGSNNLSFLAFTDWKHNQDSTCPRVASEAEIDALCAMDFGFRKDLRVGMHTGHFYVIQDTPAHKAWIVMRECREGNK